MVQDLDKKIQKLQSEFENNSLHHALIFQGAELGRIEDNALLFPFLLEGMVDHLGLVLSADAGQYLPLRLRNAELLERFLDAVRDVIPGALHAILRPDVEVDLIQV